MDFKNGEVADAITRERMRLAGLSVPGEEPAAVRQWKLDVNKENRIRETAGELLARRQLNVLEAFALAEEFVNVAYERMESIQRKEPGLG